MHSIYISSEEYNTFYQEVMLCMILWMAATMTTHSVWHSLHGWGALYQGWFYKEFAILGTQKSVPEFLFQHQFRINVWCGVLGNNLIATQVIGGLTAPHSRNFLDNELPLHLQVVPLVTRRQMRLQHDGALPHFGRGVLEFLNENYERRWKGRGGPMAWPI